MNRKLKTTGLVLIAIAMGLMLCTAAGMISTFNFASAEAASASVLAQGIHQALGPMMVGGPALITGVILLVAGWWRGRDTGRRAIR